MLDRFEIRVPIGGVTYVDDTEVQASELLFPCKGRVKVGAGLVARAEEVGGRTSIGVTRELHIPVGSPSVPVGAFARVISPACSTDPTLSYGSELRVAGPAPGSQTTARRLEVSEVLT